jgi:adenylate cyclase
MSSAQSLAQRLGRILERLTRQSGRFSRMPVYGSLLLGRATESPERRRARVQAILTVFIVVVNATGLVLAYLFAAVAFPRPSVFTDAPWWLPKLVTPAYVVAAITLGTLWLHRRTLNDLRWATEDREPSRVDQYNTMVTPWRIAVTHLVLWGAGAALLATLYGRYDPAFIPVVGLVILFCGVVVATTSYLVTEFALRPISAAALVAGEPPRGLAPGIMGRLMTVWLLGSGVPVLGIFLIAFFSLLISNLSQRQLAAAVLFTALVSLVVGFVLMWVSAWLTATPVRLVRSALRRVEKGNLDTEVVVFDGTELGELQRGFNSMVKGLREREQVRDLFGRHVGREVAAAAEQTRPRLGGEERHVGVVFVDIIGSTKLVTSRPPIEVVELLNRFFAVIVEEVDRYGGLVNKFEGDAALAVFGAPAPLDRPEDATLAAARAIAHRLRAEAIETPARIGVASGTVVAGNVGARERFEYTVIGEPVNEAARLAELARAEPTHALAAAVTVAAASEAEQRFWSAAKPVQLRGYDEPVDVAHLIGGP